MAVQSTPGSVSSNSRWHHWVTIFFFTGCLKFLAAESCHALIPLKKTTRHVTSLQSPVSLGHFGQWKLQNYTILWFNVFLFCHLSPKCLSLTPHCTNAGVFKPGWLEQYSCSKRNKVELFVNLLESGFASHQAVATGTVVPTHPESPQILLPGRTQKFGIQPSSQGTCAVY